MSDYGRVTLHHRAEPRLTITSHHVMQARHRPTVRLEFDLRWRRPALKSSYRGNRVEVVATYVRVSFGHRRWRIRWVNEIREER